LGIPLYPPLGGTQDVFFPRSTVGDLPTIDPAAIIRRHGLDHGLLLYARRQNAGRYGDWLLIAPPLVIDEPTCEELIDRLEPPSRPPLPKSSPPSAATQPQPRHHNPPSAPRRASQQRPWRQRAISPGEGQG
jgi:hypothetical protein